MNYNNKITKQSFKESGLIHISSNKIKKNLCALENERVFNLFTSHLDRNIERKNKRLLKFNY